MDSVANKNPANKKGETPLHFAATYGNLDIFRLITANVEDKNPVDIFGRTPKSLACFHGNMKLLCLFEN